MLKKILIAVVSNNIIITSSDFLWLLASWVPLPKNEFSGSPVEGVGSTTNKSNNTPENALEVVLHIVPPKLHINHSTIQEESYFYKGRQKCSHSQNKPLTLPLLAWRFSYQASSHWGVPVWVSSKCSTRNGGDYWWVPGYWGFWTWEKLWFFLPSCPQFSG